MAWSANRDHTTSKRRKEERPLRVQGTLLMGCDSVPVAV